MPEIQVETTFGVKKIPVDYAGEWVEWIKEKTMMFVPKMRILGHP